MCTGSSPVRGKTSERGDLPAFLAHGALGVWDELIFLGITVVFVLIMAWSWLRSRNLADEADEGDDTGDPGDFTLD